MATEDADWELWYWPAHFAGPGRGEFARLIFIETETSWSEPLGDMTSPEDGYNKMKALRKERPGFFAYPGVHDKKNDVFLSQTAAFCHYLATCLGDKRLLPSDAAGQAEALMLMSNVCDVVTEGELAWHPIKRNGSYTEQKEEAVPFIKEYREKRLPVWLDVFETRLAKQQDPLHLIGGKLSYVDLALWFVLDGNEVESPDVFKKAQTSHLDAFRKNIASLPRIKAWTESSKRGKFTMTGPIF